VTAALTDYVGSLSGEGVERLGAALRIAVGVE